MHKWILFVRGTSFYDTVRKKSRHINNIITETLLNDHIGMVDADSLTTAIGIEEYKPQLHLKRKTRPLCQYQDTP